MEYLEIKSWITGKVIYSGEANSLKELIEKAVKEGADLRGADLDSANLRGAYLQGADLEGADLEEANLEGANLDSANLRGAYLRGANLEGANLRKVNLEGANLRGVNLRGAYLEGANLKGAKGLSLLACPETGEFIAWKKCANNTSVKLLIPAEAKRSSAITKKCRASKVKVLEILDKGGQLINETENNGYGGASIITYRVGEVIEIKDFDENRWNECSTGIHFFMEKQDAIDW
jgi:hypothetical protein